MASLSRSGVNQAVGLAIAALLALAPATSVTAEEAAPHFVGKSVCAECHASEAAQWQGSNHDKAMQVATPDSVLGDFNDARYDYDGLTTTFYRKGERYFVRSDGPDGKLADFEITYTFGVYPLQQYLIAFPGGRYQAFGIAWDSRTKDKGGQRWFHLYPNQKVKAGDYLHWTGPNQNWNYQCADCHSTDLRKNYDLQSNTYNTTWAEIDVACEACHGPGAAHVKWAREPDASPAIAHKGLVVDFTDAGAGSWTMDAASGIAHRTAPRQNHAEVDVCGRCHSRREELSRSYAYGKPLLNSRRPALLDARLYHPDGQIDDEVFELGSFLQSKMHRAGVTCSNCHDPHSLRLRVDGNGLCAQCHLPEKFDTAEHHHHAAGSPGSQCASCHMPTRNYMVVHARHDHSIRVPRPDLSVTLGTPNACTGCHTDRQDEWAIQALKGWYGDKLRLAPHYGSVFHKADRGDAESAQALAGVALDGTLPAIVRATAVSRLPDFSGSFTPDAIKAYVQGLADEDGLVRTAALRALAPFAAEDRLHLAGRLLGDRLRSVRIEAARALAGVARDTMSSDQQAALERATDELLESFATTAERPESHVGAGNIYLQQGQAAKAEEAYKTALRLAPKFVPAMVNLADLYRMTGRDGDAVGVLEDALEVEPGNAPVLHALGLAMVRRKDLAGAIDYLGRSFAFAPGNARYGYVYAIALNSQGRREEALDVLKQSHAATPADTDVLMALVTISRDSGDRKSALEYARKLAALRPLDPQVKALFQSLQ